MKKSLVIFCCLVPFFLGAAHKEMTLENLYLDPPLIGIPPQEVKWSPDEGKGAFIWRGKDGGISNLYYYSEIAPSKIIQVTHFSGKGIREFCWGRTKNELVYFKDGHIFLHNLSAGESIRIVDQKAARTSLCSSPDHRSVAYIEKGNIHILNLEKRKSRFLSALNPGEGRISFFRWSPDSRRIAFVWMETKNIRRVGVPVFNPEKVSIRQIIRPFPGDPIPLQKVGILETAGSSLRWLNMEIENLLSLNWSPDGKRILLETSADYAARRRLWSIDIDTLQPKNLMTEYNPRNTASGIWRSKWLDDRHIIFTSDRSGFRHLYIMDLSSRTITQQTSGKWEVFDFQPAGGFLYYTANTLRPEDRDLFRLQPGNKTASRMGGRDGVYIPFISPSGKEAAALFSDDMTPFDLYRIEGSHMERVTISPNSGFSDFEWAKTEYLTIPGGSEGAEVRVKIIKPSDFSSKKKYPAIIGSVYANAVLNQWGGRDAHPTWGLDQYLVQKEKFILMNVDIRSSMGYGKTFREDMFQGYGVVDIEDLAAAAYYLKSLPYIQENSIGIWGSSYGGLLTLMCLFKMPDVFCCGIAGAPATNVGHAFPGQQEVMKSTDDREAFARSSAVNWSGNLKKPVMIIHGIKDSVVLFMDSVRLVGKLIKEGKNVDFVTLPDAPHAWDMGPLLQTLYAFRKMVDFFRLHMKGEIPAAQNR